MTAARISMKDLHDKRPGLGERELILDVRTPDEYQGGHIPGSRNIPHDQLTAHLAELRNYKTVYLHCRSGKRAAEACDNLLLGGLKNVVLVADSGMDDWIRAGFPVEK